MIVIDPDCVACAECGELIGRGPYALTVSNAVVHPECDPVIGYLVDGKVWHPSDVTIIRRETAAPNRQETRCGTCGGRGGFAASGEVCSDCLGTGSIPANA